MKIVYCPVYDLSVNEDGDLEVTSHERFDVFKSGEWCGIQVSWNGGVREVTVDV